MIDTMKMIVTTPTLTPRIVSAERSLFVRSVSSAIKADSLMSSSRIAVDLSGTSCAVALGPQAARLHTSTAGASQLARALRSRAGEPPAVPVFTRSNSTQLSKLQSDPASLLAMRARARSQFQPQTKHQLPAPPTQH